MSDPVSPASDEVSLDELVRRISVTFDMTMADILAPALSGRDYQQKVGCCDIAINVSGAWVNLRSGSPFPRKHHITVFKNRFSDCQNPLWDAFRGLLPSLQPRRNVTRLSDIMHSIDPDDYAKLKLFW